MGLSLLIKTITLTKIQNILKPLPVGSLIQNSETPNRLQRFEHYLIPYYQRGYRWDEINVRSLLEDIDNFIKADSGKYCLQPVVVVPGNDDEGNNIWEVVDGQQRLITMFIIFKVIGKRKYKLIFEKREKSTSFLENLSPETYSDENPDFHFMSQAHKIITKWFEDKMRNDVGYEDDFYARLTKKVEVIWYQIGELKKIERGNDVQLIESKKIDIFNRLNIGKIPLSDAELIRALLLSKIKYGLSDRESIMRQAEISNEWHEMEIALRNEEFWLFLNSNPLQETFSTIELIFKLIAGEDSKNYSTYLWFENYIKDEDPAIEKEKAEDLWSNTKQYFHKFKYWFEDSTLYHHLGFLLIYQGDSISKLREIAKNSNQTKTKFEKWAVDQVKNEMNGISLENITYDSAKKELEKVFLLHNVLSTQKLLQYQNKRFPFNLYKKIMKNGGWSIEHIHAQQSEEMTDEKSMRKWMEDTYKAIENISMIEKEKLDEVEDEEQPKSIIEEKKIDDLKEGLKNLLQANKIDPIKFNLLKNEIIDRFDSGSVHVLDNLALLPSKINSSLNNAIFPVKRNRLLELQKNGAFIPLATMNVFLKYYSTSDLQPYYWSKADKSEYFNNIKFTLSNYLN